MSAFAPDSPTEALEPSAAGRGWADRIDAGLRNGRFAVHLQPVVDLATQDVVGYEALSRLIDECGVLVMPADFITRARERGVMPDVDRHAVAVGLELLATGAADRVFVNLDRTSFQSDAFLDGLERMLAAGGDHAAGVTLDVAADAPLADVARARARLEALRALGATVALDDFEATSSPVSLIGSLPSDVIKLSPDSTAAIAVDPDAARLVRAIAHVAHAMGKQLVAEGVEDRDVANVLRHYDIALAQGYLYARPAPIERFARR